MLSHKIENESWKQKFIFKCTTALEKPVSITWNKYLKIQIFMLRKSESGTEIADSGFLIIDEKPVDFGSLILALINLPQSKI